MGLGKQVDDLHKYKPTMAESLHAPLLNALAERLGEEIGEEQRALVADFAIAQVIDRAKTFALLYVEEPDPEHLQARLLREALAVAEPHARQAKALAEALAGEPLVAAQLAAYYHINLDAELPDDLRSPVVRLIDDLTDRLMSSGQPMAILNAILDDLLDASAHISRETTSRPAPGPEEVNNRFYALTQQDFTAFLAEAHGRNTENLLRALARLQKA
ncbi:MAG: hypothetical protein ACI4RT_01155 [Candidatus Spyradenecus sp.]